MIYLILACSILLSFVIDLGLLQSFIVVVFVMGVYFTGRRIDKGHYRMKCQERI